MDIETLLFRSIIGFVVWTVACISIFIMRSNTK